VLVVVVSLLSPEEKEILLKAIGLLEELIETLEVMGDKDLCRDLKEALKEFKEGKTRPLDDLRSELGLEGDGEVIVYVEFLEKFYEII